MTSFSSPRAGPSKRVEDHDGSLAAAGTSRDGASIRTSAGGSASSTSSKKRSLLSSPSRSIGHHDAAAAAAAAAPQRRSNAASSWVQASLSPAMSPGGGGRSVGNSELLSSMGDSSKLSSLSSPSSPPSHSSPSSNLPSHLPTAGPSRIANGSLSPLQHRRSRARAGTSFSPSDEDDDDDGTKIPAVALLDDDDQFNSSAEEDEEKEAETERRNVRRRTTLAIEGGDGDRGDDGDRDRDSDSDESIADLTIGNRSLSGVAPRRSPRREVGSAAGSGAAMVAVTESPRRVRRKGDSNGENSPTPVVSRSSVQPADSDGGSNFNQNDADAMSGLSSAEEETNERTRRPKRTAAKQSKYKFRPSLHKPFEPPVTYTAAERAKIHPKSSEFKLSIDALLREKRRKDNKGTSLNWIEKLSDRANEWAAMQVDSPSKPVYDDDNDDDKMGQQIRQLNEAYVARATEGLGDREKGEAAQSSSRTFGDHDRRHERASPDSLDVNPLHLLWEEPEGVGSRLVDSRDRGSSSPGDPTGAVDLATISEALHARGGGGGGASGSEQSEDEEQERQTLMSILARDEEARAKDTIGNKPTTANGVSDSTPFWRSGRVPLPAAAQPEATLASTKDTAVRAFLAAHRRSARHLLGYMSSGLFFQQWQPAGHAHADNAEFIRFLVSLAIQSPSPDLVGAVLSTLERVCAFLGDTSKAQVEIVDALAEILERLGARPEALVPIADCKSSAQPVAFGPSAGDRDGVPPLLTPQLRAQAVSRVLQVCGLLLRHDILNTRQLPQLVQLLHQMACDDASMVPATLADFHSVIEGALRHMPWRCFPQGWTSILLPDSLFGHASADRYKSRCLHALQRFPSGSSKARLARQECAIEILFPTCTTRGAPDLVQLLAALESDDPTTNPLHIYSYAAERRGCRTDYRELLASVRMLGIALADVPLLLCEGATPASMAGKTDPVPLQGPTPPIPRAEDSPPESSAQEPPSSDASSGSEVSRILDVSTSSPTREHNATPVVHPNGDAATQQSPPPPPPPRAHRPNTLHANRAFKTAMSSYTLDPSFQRTVALPLHPHPSFSRMRTLHRLIDVLRATYGRIVDGRCGLAASGGPGGGGGPTSVGVGIKRERDEASPSTHGVVKEHAPIPSSSSSVAHDDPLERSRVKDALQRLVLTLQYQVETYTGWRVGGDAILDEDEDQGEDDDDDGSSTRAEVLTDRHNAHALTNFKDGLIASPSAPTSTSTSALTSSSSTSPPARDTPTRHAHTSKDAQKQPLRPRASDQRGLAEFLSSNRKVEERG